MRCYLALFLVACSADRAIQPPVPCCIATDGVLTCRDNTCPELSVAEECTTLDFDHTCQVPLTSACEPVVLERAGTARMFRTVYCF